ncbi:MAG: DUF6516 family protein [candidate division KSB1 bacterium]
MKPSREEYEAQVYRAAELSSHIEYSDLVLVPAGRKLATLSGAISFKQNIRLVIREALDFALEEWITGYGYVVYKNNERQYWYDSQEHPNDPSLAPTHPHHKHISPDIKHHRIPAPNISFKVSNLPFLIQEIEEEFFPI